MVKDSSIFASSRHAYVGKEANCKSYAGESNAVFSVEMTRQMLTPPPDGWYGLGFYLISVVSLPLAGFGSIIRTVKLLARDLSRPAETGESEAHVDEWKFC